MSTNLSQQTSPRLQNPSVSQEQRTAQAKAAFEESLKSTGSAVDNELQARAKIIHANAKGLDKQDKQVLKDTKQLTRETDSMEKFLAKSRKAMPNIDSFEDDIARIEAELDMFDEMLDEVEHRDGDEQDDGELNQPHSTPTTTEVPRKP